MITKAEAIKKINPDAEFAIRGGNVEFVIPEISAADIEAKRSELQTAYDSQEYARNRQAEYPSINELIVALWENVIEERAASVIELEAKRQDVKTKYPKS